MTMEPFHFLWRHDPLKLENKLRSMIDNYCDHESDGNIYWAKPPKSKCKKCGVFW